MEQDVEKTLVIFRKYNKKHKIHKDSNIPEILALFPEIDEGRGLCSCYQHVGQHGGADYYYCIHDVTVPASPEEYADLKEELESIGYNLDVRRKWVRR